MLFEYNKLSYNEKELINLIGDHSRVQTYDIMTKAKSLKKIYEEGFAHMKPIEFFEITKSLVLKGIAWYGDRDSGIIYTPYMDMDKDEYRKKCIPEIEKIEKLYPKDGGNPENFGSIRLTKLDEGFKFPGESVYEKYREESILARLTFLRDSIDQKNKEIRQIESETILLKQELPVLRKKIENSSIKNVEILSIFIAIIALLGQNIFLFGQYNFKTWGDLLIMLVLVNIIFLGVVASILWLVKKIIKET